MTSAVKLFLLTCEIRTGCYQIIGNPGNHPKGPKYNNYMHANLKTFTLVVRQGGEDGDHGSSAHVEC